MSVLKKFAGQTMIYGMSTIIARLLYFIMTPLYVNKYTPSAYGIFTNLYSWASMINAFLAFGMETTYFRYLEKVEEKDKSKVFNNSFLIISFLAILFLLTTLLFSEAIGVWLGHGVHTNEFKEYVQFFAIILTLDALAVVPFAKLRAKGKAIRFGLIKLINIIVMIVLNIGFIIVVPYMIKYGGEANSEYFVGWYREGWIGYVFISNLVASAITLLLLLPEIKGLRFELDKTLAKSMLTYSFPILVANISFIVNENLDKIIIPMYLPEGVGDRDVGIYGAVGKLAMFLSIFVQAFRLGAEPFFFSHAKKSNARTTYATIMQYFVIATLLVMVWITANIDWLKFFIKGNSITQSIYWSGLFIVPLLLFNYVLLGIYMNLSVWYKLSDQTKYGLYISGIGAIITVVANLILIPKYSYVGAAFVTTLAYLSMVVMSYVWGQKHYPIPYNLRKILTYVILGSGFTYLSYFVFNHNFFIGNGLFVVFLIIILILERKQIKALLKKS